MRVVLAGNEKIGYECLKTLIEERHEVVGVVTDKPDKKTKLENKRIKFLATQAGIKVYEVEDINHSDFVKELRQLDPHVIFNTAFLQLYKAPVLSIPKLGCINFHPGPLPRYGGSNGWVWAIINGETEYGVTFHYMEEKIDTGHIVAIEKFNIEENETGLSLLMKCYDHGAALFKKKLKSILDGTAVSVPQDLSKRSYYYNKIPYGGMIDTRWSAVEICNFVKALNFHPFPNPLSPALIGFKGIKLRITAARALGDAVTHTVSCGEVVDVHEEGVVMQTGKGLVLLTLSDRSSPLINTARICAANGIGKRTIIG